MISIADSGHQQARIGETAADWKVPKDPTDRRNVIDGCRRQGLEGDWKAGKCLLAQKNELGHGNFMDWYEDCGYDKHWVAKRLKLVENYPNQLTLRAQFATMTEALDALKKPKKPKGPPPTECREPMEGDICGETEDLCAKCGSCPEHHEKSECPGPKPKQTKKVTVADLQLKTEILEAALARSEKARDLAIGTRDAALAQPRQSDALETEERHRRQIDSAYRDVKDLKKALAASYEKREELEATVSEMEGDNQSLRDDVDTWKHRAELAKAECDRLRKRCAELAEGLVKGITDDLVKSELEAQRVEIEHLRGGE